MYYSYCYPYFLFLLFSFNYQLFIQLFYKGIINDMIDLIDPKKYIFFILSIVFYSYFMELYSLKVFYTILL